MSDAMQNKDREIWRKSEEHYAPSIHVTESGGIGINCGGHVIVMPIEKWHTLGMLRIAIEGILE